MMRRSIDPHDPAFVGEDCPGFFVRLDGRVFDRGLIIMADTAGVIRYVPVTSDGFISASGWKETNGKVEIFDFPPGAARLN